MLHQRQSFYLHHNYLINWKEVQWIWDCFGGTVLYQWSTWNSFRAFIASDRQHFWLNFVFFSEHITVLERRHHVCDLESTETVTCSAKVQSDLNQSISWYNGGTNVKIKTGGRIELNGLSLKIKNVQQDDAGTYECRGASSTRFYTIYVNGEYSLLLFVTSTIFRYTTPRI